MSFIFWFVGGLLVVSIVISLLGTLHFLEEDNTKATFWLSILTFFLVVVDFNYYDSVYEVDARLFDYQEKLAAPVVPPDPVEPPLSSAPTEPPPLTAAEWDRILNPRKIDGVTR